MKGIYSITVSQMESLVNEHIPMPQAHLDRLIEACQLSRQLFAGIHDETLLGFVGFIPPTLLSDSAYVWLYHTPNTRLFSFIFAKMARDVIRSGLTIYTSLFGDCMEQSAHRFLRWVGAEITPRADFWQFMIRRPT